jgi:hypothetical protein
VRRELRLGRRAGLVAGRDAHRLSLPGEPARPHLPDRPERGRQDDHHRDAGLTNVHNPSWSPDGTKIAFELHTGGGTFGIFTISAADGSGETGIAGTEDEMRFDPSGWQPVP